MMIPGFNATDIDFMLESCVFYRFISLFLCVFFPVFSFLYVLCTRCIIN